MTNNFIRLQALGPSCPFQFFGRLVVLHCVMILAQKLGKTLQSVVADYLFPAGFARFAIYVIKNFTAFVVKTMDSGEFSTPTD
jgi:hypothetical protein